MNVPILSSIRMILCDHLGKYILHTEKKKTALHAQDHQAAHRDPNILENIITVMAYVVTRKIH